MLQESLLAMILEEGYDEISIQDITDKANLGRATFYLHYKDKDDLLLDVMDQLIADFMGQIPQLTEAHWHMEDTKLMTKLFDFAAQHYDLYRILTISSGGITAGRQLHSTIAESIKGYIQSEVDSLKTEPAVPVDFIANQFTGSLLATIYWWLDRELPYSAEEMAIMFQKINQLDRDRLLGKNQPEPTSESEQEQDKAKKRGKTKDNQRSTQPESGGDTDQEAAPEEKSNNNEENDKDKK